jgi:hypothetical protein
VRFDVGGGRPPLGRWRPGPASPSPTCEGEGDALAWFTLDGPGTVDEIPIADGIAPGLVGVLWLARRLAGRDARARSRIR